MFILVMLCHHTLLEMSNLLLQNKPKFCLKVCSNVMKFTSHAMSFLVMELVSSSSEMLMDLRELTLIQLQMNNSSLATKKERFGTLSSEPSQQVMKNAEQILAVSIFVPSKKFTTFSDSKMMKLTKCSGLIACLNSEKELLVFLSIMLRLKSGDKLILRVLLYSQCGYIKIKNLRSSISKLLAKMKIF